MTIAYLSNYNQTSIIQDIIGIEGGDTETDDPNDHGGDTKYGVTLKEAATFSSQLKSQFGWDGTMTNFTEAMAMWVYVNGYWNVMNLTTVFNVHPLLAHKLFDIGVNLGVGEAGQFLQRVLNVLNKGQAWYPNLKVDGNIGSVTAGALATYVQKRGSAPMGVWHVLFGLTALQGNFYITDAEHDATQESFEDGWLERAADIFGHDAALLHYQ
ncbi:MAG TPA: glycosyl hydrolase 108 family protein [Dongiaceae bacterium]|nr:glycosyl hydrolase 108 family protein [Dongiaceae bacterium]